MYSKYLDPKVVSSLANIELQAHQVVEGFISGLHKSPFHGFSVEFSQHRPYFPGDSLRFMDWKVYGRTDRYYIRQYEQETNLRAHILLDISNSMEFGSSGIKKIEYAKILTASLAYILIRQKDAAGLILFDNMIRKFLPPKSVISFLPQIFYELDKTASSNDTQISSVLHQVADRINRRSMLIIISDFFDDPNEVMKGLRHFRHDQHEVIVFHLMDPQELALDYSGEVKFNDLETNQHIQTHPAFIRESYKQHMDEFLEYYRVQCSNQKINYHMLTTDTNFHKALNQFLLKREKLF